MTLEEVERWLATAIVGVYHRDLHRGIDTTPLAAWESGILGDDQTPGRGETTAVTDVRRFLIDFLPMEHRLVRREGVFLRKIRYWSDVLSTLIGEREKMIVRYDPRDLSRIYLLAPDGAYYDVPYADLRRPAISLWEHRLLTKRLREAGRAEIDEAALFEAFDEMKSIVEGAVAQTKTVRRQRERRLQAERRSEPAAAVGLKNQPAPSLADLPEEERLFTNVEEWL